MKMTIEMLMLGATGGLLLILTLLQGTRNVILLGLPTAAGNQHDMVPWTGWNDRLNRAIKNLIESIAIFAPIVIAIQMLGLNDELTVFGAQLFVFARIIHVFVYTLGVTWVRTAAWFLGVVGIVMVASPLLG